MSTERIRIFLSTALVYSCVLLNCSESASNQDESFVIVQHGQALAVIVVSPDVLRAFESLDPKQANPGLVADKVAWAARDLQVYLEKMSGAKLPIVADDAPVEAKTRILVGRGKLTAKYDAGIPSGLTPLREEEGYAIFTDGDTLALVGNDQGPYHGTEYAVSFFLHRLGVRWYMPGDFGEVIPRRNTIAIGKISEVSHPDFKIRNWWTHWFANDLRPIETRWKIRNGMNLDAMHTIPRDSSVRALLPPEKERDNPEFTDVFARDAQGRVYPHMPNLSSEKSVQYAANIIKDYFRQNPEATSWGIGADDGLPRDFSPATEALHMNFPSMIGRFNDPKGLSTTEEWMRWVQLVAAEVYKEFPERFISTNGYANRDTPPIGITPDPKIWIMFGPIFCDTYHSLDNRRSWMTQRQYSMLKDWTSMYDNVWMYGYLYYNCTGCGAPPIPLARRHMREMPILKELGLIGFFDEGRTVRGESGVFPTYLRARMMWDAHLDAQALMDEFFTNWYGPAAKPAFAFWDEMERAIEESIWAGNEDHMLSLVYTPALIKQLETHLKKAEALAKGDEWAEPRVLADRVTFNHLLAYKAMERAEFDADWVEAAKQAQAMIDSRKPATAVSRFYWDPAKTAKPHVGEAHGYYYWGSIMRRNYYRKLAELTAGEKGRMIAVLPEQAKFSIDPRDDGRFEGWYRSNYDDSKWETMLTTLPFYTQGPYVDEQGYPYMGALWYRLEVDVPATAADQPVRIYCMAAETEAWVWVNGKFVGHRPYFEAYIRPNAIDMDVTDALVPGQKNRVAIRLHTNIQPAQMAAGLASRLFLYSPKETPTAAQ